jgi:hypothetical protein
MDKNQKAPSWIKPGILANLNLGGLLYDLAEDSIEEFGKEAKYFLPLTSEDIFPIHSLPCTRCLIIEIKTLGEKFPGEKDFVVIIVSGKIVATRWINIFPECLSSQPLEQYHKQIESHFE